ncbi:MAG: hypothetical protein RIR55_1508 [Bacteroidota bacterium]|jgi:hypothetical protein
MDSDIDKTAKYVRTDSTQFVVLFGYKKLMSHDLKSLFLNEYYLDSIQLLLKSTNKSVSEKDIFLEKRGYPIVGHVVIKKNKVVVNVFQKNTDLNKFEDIGWNGTYLFR